MSSPMLGSGHLERSGTLRELTARSLTVAFRETQAITMLLSVGEGRAEEMGSTTFSSSLLKKLRPTFNFEKLFTYREVAKMLRRIPIYTFPIPQI